MRINFKKLFNRPIPYTPTREELCQNIKQAIFTFSIPRFIVQLTQWLWKIIPPILIAIFVWVVVGNFVADRLAVKPNRELEAWIEQHPRQEPNDSALKLWTYYADLGLRSSTYSTSSSPFSDYGHYLDLDVAFEIKSDNSLSQQQHAEISDYFDTLKQSNEGELPDIPNSTIAYIDDNAELILTIAEYITSNKSPLWGIDLPAFIKDPEGVIPSRLNQASLSKLILLSAIRDIKLSLDGSAQKKLKAVWKLNESLAHGDMLVDQLVSIIIGKDYISCIRRVDPKFLLWYKDLEIFDYRKSLLKSFEIEVYFQFSFWNKVDAKAIENIGIEPSYFGLTHYRLINQFTLPIVRPYQRFLAIRNISSFRKQYNEIYDLISCKTKSSSLDTPFFAPSQLNKGENFMLELELTHKILQAKSLSSEIGTWPKKLPNSKSEVCPEEHWIYKVEGNEMSIEFSTVPDWLPARIESGRSLPLEYHASLQR
ncbi:MAG: hypothetical protein F6J87_20265 [Spirulina sp. SIO3F2]|nr:hypothetical protein [Spirulina sp. SIO3F2]